MFCLVVCAASCSSGLKVVIAGEGKPWQEPYSRALDDKPMNGVENLVFDGEGALFVTGLDGMIYKIEPTENPARGRTVAQKKLGTMCLGIVFGPDGLLYVAVADPIVPDNNPVKGRRIVRMDRNFSQMTVLTDAISGLNGMTRDSRDFLYYTSSNESLLWPKGGVYRIKFGADENFKKPELMIPDAGMVNGLAFSPDESVLYFTETTNGVWTFDMQTKSKKQIYSPPGFLQIVDDLTADKDGTVWLCLNSEGLLVPLSNGKARVGFRPGKLVIPSAVKFGRGKGFSEDMLFLTEYGLKGRSFTRNGRGVWAVPVRELIRD